jgi:hypothetical protein
MHVVHASPSSAATPREDSTGLPEHDLRELPCPLPLELALELADALAPGQAVRVLTPQRPLPLLDLLAARGLQVTTALLADGGARLLICRPAHA